MVARLQTKGLEITLFGCLSLTVISATQWTVKRISKLGFNLPVVRVIRPVHDPARYLSVHENGDDVVSHSQESEWIAMPTPDGHFK